MSEPLTVQPTHFTKDHEWVTVHGEIATMGITKFAAEQLGDVVFVELPEIGKTFQQGADIAVVESVKAASDVYAPISGEIVEVNEALTDAPEKVNEDPEGAAGWFCKLKVANADELAALMDKAAYDAFVASEAG